MTNNKTLQDYIKNYKDTSEYNGKIIQEFIVGTNTDKQLKAHREYIESYQNNYNIVYGHGHRCLHYMWKLIVDEQPNEFKFLEIGVYKGQILSLIELLANKENKKAKIVGITPLFDKEFANYNRMPFIENLYKKFDINMENTTIIDGFSQDSKNIKQAYEKGPYDIVYIDGDHSYEATVEDINNYDKCLKAGGYMIIDDASDYKNMPENVFNYHLNKMDKTYKGIFDVSNAVRDTLEQNKNYKDVLTCMHVRIFKKL